MAGRMVLTSFGAMSEETELEVCFKNPQTVQMGLLNNFIGSISNRTTEATEAAKTSNGKGRFGSSSSARTKELAPLTKGLGSNLGRESKKKAKEALQELAARQKQRKEVVVQKEVEPQDLLDQTNNTYCRLCVERWAMVACEDLIILVDCLRHNQVGGNLLAERCSAVIAKMSMELETLRRE
uniref:Uncharacterized protein n=1 Tax=Cannabis sativa TaxID=3483 RepID=A0A803P3T0_CANSA